MAWVNPRVRAGQAHQERGTAPADLGNLFPRMFRLVTVGHTYTVHLWWWKFASPVRNGDTITVCGSRRDLPGPDVIRVSSFTSQWLQIHNP